MEFDPSLRTARPKTHGPRRRTVRPRSALAAASDSRPTRIEGVTRGFQLHVEHPAGAGQLQAPPSIRQRTSRVTGSGGSRGSRSRRRALAGVSRGRRSTGPRGHAAAGPPPSVRISPCSGPPARRELHARRRAAFDRDFGSVAPVSRRGRLCLPDPASEVQGSPPSGPASTSTGRPPEGGPATRIAWMWTRATAGVGRSAGHSSPTRTGAAAAGEPQTTRAAARSLMRRSTDLPLQSAQSSLMVRRRMQDGFSMMHRVCPCVARMGNQE